MDVKLNKYTASLPLMKDINAVNQQIHKMQNKDFRWLFDSEQDDILDQTAYIKERLIADRIEFHELDSLSNILESSSPSDYISFTKDTKEWLQTYAKNNLGLDYISDIDARIPNDIFIANTIPLPDFCFVMTIYDGEYKHITDEFIIRFIVYKNKLFMVFGNTKQGKLITAVTLIEVNEGYLEIDNSIMYCNHPNDLEFQENRYKAAVKTMTLALANYMLIEWYTVQVLLLHPVIKERLFVQGNKEKLRTNNSEIIGNANSSKKSRKRKAKYVRYKSLDESLFKSEIIRKRHTLCWYVIGHYRHYKNGSKTFVHGYWKGPLRELKKNLDEGRERILAQ